MKEPSCEEEKKKKEKKKRSSWKNPAWRRKERKKREKRRGREEISVRWRGKVKKKKWPWVSDCGSHKVAIFIIMPLKLSFQLLKTLIWCFQFSSLSLKIFEFEWWNNIWKSSQTKKIVWIPCVLIIQLWVLNHITQNSSKPNSPWCSINSCNLWSFSSCMDSKDFMRIQNNTLEGHSFWSLNQYHNQHWNSLPCPIHSLCGGCKVSSFNYLTHPIVTRQVGYKCNLCVYMRKKERELPYQSYIEYFSVTENVNAFL